MLEGIENLGNESLKKNRAVPRGNKMKRIRNRIMYLILLGLFSLLFEKGINNILYFCGMFISFISDIHFY
ncbi:hypothetical protein ACFLZK_02885, partial [Patescibacteria group bacterium]